MKKLFLLIIIFSLTGFCFSEKLNSPKFGYTFDIPEEYVLSEKSSDGTSYVFTNKLFPVTTVIKIYSAKKYKSSAEALNDTLNKLKADGDTEEFPWRSQISGVSVFRFTLNGTVFSGYGISAELSDDKGIIVMFDYCPEQQAEQFNAVMVSTLDSLSIDQGSLYESGLMTQYLFPQQNKKNPVKLNIDGKTINTILEANDRESATYVIEREYAVLLNYMQSTQWKQAWTRYYRIIYRDSFKRLQRPAFDIYNELSKDAKDETDLAQKLLTWTQNFEYDRAKSQQESDFTSLPDVLCGKGCDCDSRSMLIAVLLKQMNMDSIFFISAEYSHAIAGLVSTHPGHSFSYDNKKYLTGETTAKGVNWGMIAQDMADVKKWIPVSY